MVCMVQCGRMAAMMRFLKTGGFPEVNRGLASHEKIAAQSLLKELHDANEANLLEEEDMHVFDCRPLTDPLHLVCCNTCKKPVKASQYAAHAERCWSINSGSDPSLELSGGSGQRKPPKKGRKAHQATNGYQGMITEEREKFESIDGNDVDCSESNFDNQTELLSMQPKDGQGCKIQKLMARREVPSSASTKYQNDVQVLENGLVIEESPPSSADAPSPLATKVYYSQGRNRLRLQLGHLYNRANAKELGNESECAEQMQDNEKLPPQLSYSNKLLSGALTNGKSLIKVPCSPMQTLLQVIMD